MKAAERALNMNGTLVFSEKRRTLGTLGLSIMKVSMLVEEISITLFSMYLAHALAILFVANSPSISKAGIGIGGYTLTTGKSLTLSFAHISG